MSTSTWPTSIDTFAFTPVTKKAVPYDDYLKMHDAILALEGTFTNGLAQAVVYNNNTQSIGSGAWTACTFDSEEIDIGNLHSTVSNTSRLTVPAAGRYRLHAVVNFAGGTGTRGVRFFKNGTTVIGSSTNMAAINASGFGGGLANELVVSLAALDFVEVQAFQDTGGALNVGAATGSANRFLQCQFSVTRQW